jgi:hypothetical protein
VELNWKAICTGDKHFSLSFSRYALPQVTGEKKVGRRLAWRRRLASDGGGMRSDDRSKVLLRL